MEEVSCESPLKDKMVSKAPNINNLFSFVELIELRKGFFTKSENNWQKYSIWIIENCGSRRNWDLQDQSYISFEIAMATLQNLFHSCQVDALEASEHSIRPLNESHTSFWKKKSIIDECFILPVAVK